MNTSLLHRQIDNKRTGPPKVLSRALCGALLTALLLGLTPLIESAAIGQITNAIIDLAIERDTRIQTVQRGAEVRWQLTVRNLQSDENGVDQVLVREILSSELQLIEVSPSRGVCDVTNSTAYECSLGLIAQDSSAVIIVVAQVSGSPQRDRLTSTAYVSNNSGKVDPVLDNNVAALNIQIAEERDLSRLIVSPLCAHTGGKLLVTGAGLLNIAEQGLDVRIGSQSATAILLGDTSFTIIVPQLSPGSYTVQINGIALNKEIDIDPRCGIQAIDAEQLRADIVPGELMIFFKERISEAEIEAFRAEYGFEALREYPLLGFHHGRLPSEVLSEQNEDGETGNVCSAQRLEQHPNMNLMLLVDVSGTMDSVQLRKMVLELIDTFDCAINPSAQVGLMTYSSEPEVVLPMDSWIAQRDRLLQWINGPILIGGLSNLGEALLQASGLLARQTSSSVDRNVFLLTRGLSVPVLNEANEIETSYRADQIALSGIAFTNIFFGRAQYARLDELIANLGRSLTYFNERMPHDIERVAQCAVVIGLYALEQCSSSPYEQIPLVERVQVDPTERMMELIANDFRIDQVCLNTLVEHEQFADPQLGDQTWLQQLGVEHIESYFPRLGNGVTIALIDTGIDLSLSESGEIDINPSIPEGLSFATSPNDTGNASDVVGHGTKVASVSAAVGNGLNGIGVAPRASVVPIRVFASTDSGVKGNSLWVAEAIASAYLMGADVINMSLGDRSRVNVGCQKVSSRDFYERVFSNLESISQEAGLGKSPIIVAATGNDGRSVRCPACVESVISVGSVRLDDEGDWERSPFSNYGEEIDFVAQGDHILTTLQGGEFGDTGPGTSFSAPQVTGLIALMLAENPNLTAIEAVERLKACFIEDLLAPGWDEETGWGRIVIPAPSDSNSICLPSSN